MSADGFDGLAKALAATPSRRAVLKGLLKGVAVTLGASVARALGAQPSAAEYCQCQYDCGGTATCLCRFAGCPASFIFRGQPHLRCSLLTKNCVFSSDGCCA